MRNEQGDDPDLVSQRVASRAHESVDRAARRAADYETRLRREVGEAGERVRATGRRARRAPDDAVRSVDDYVRANPFTSLVVAFAAGALWTALRRRRHRRDDPEID